MKQYPEIVAEMFAVLKKNKKQSMERANLMMGSNKKNKDSEAHEHTFGLIVWPPKNYNCSFCKREFRSAQALGGHMNVHRRDRARLRMFSPPLLEYPNSNPSFASTSSSLSFSASSSAFTNEEKKRLLECPREIALTPTPSGGLRKKKKNVRAAVYGIDEVLKKKEDQLAISLDLEMGLKVTKEAVDLELRLGYH